MNLLAIDTAARLCAACVLDTETGRELGREVLDLGKGHAEQLMDVIDAALSDAGVGYAELGMVAVSVGPGSFTGVRVGVSAAGSWQYTGSKRAADALGAHCTLLRKGRGMLVAGRTVPEAFVLMFYLIRSCQVQVPAVTGGAELVLPSHEVAEHTAQQYERDPTPAGKREWPALLRMLDRLNPSYTS